ncbi:unnamed protein product, partial [marine sediment metagenome]
MTTEKIIDNDEIREKPWLTVIPFFLVDAVIEVPYGSHPCNMPYKYYFDEEHIGEWLEMSRTPEGVNKYFEKYVYSVEKFEDYLELIGGQKNGNYIVNGTKIFISNAPIADVVIVMAKTNPEKGARGISAIIVEKDAPGFNKGITLDKMGFRGLQVGELIFENCTVSEENLLGKEGLGFLQAMKVLEQGRVAVAGVGVAIAQACLEESVTRSNKRIQFGKPISNFQLIQQKLADMKARIDASRLLTYKAACLIS